MPDIPPSLPPYELYRLVGKFRRLVFPLGAMWCLFGAGDFLTGTGFLLCLPTATPKRRALALFLGIPFCRFRKCLAGWGSEYISQTSLAHLCGLDLHLRVFSVRQLPVFHPIQRLEFQKSAALGRTDARNCSSARLDSSRPAIAAAGHSLNDADPQAPGE